MTLTGWNVFTQKDGNAPLLTGLSSTAKPAAPPDKWLLFETDTGKGYYSSGGAWVLVSSGGGGTVTNVTATAPLASSGGTTPDISLPLPADATKFLNGIGTFTVPAGTSTGDVVGPSSAVADDIATFNGTTGKLIKDGGKKIADLVLANGAITGATKTKITYDAKGLVTAGADATLASADFANQGTTTTVLHGNAAGNPAFGSVVAGDIASDAVTTVKILDDNVTYAKMQNAAANTFIARAANSSGDLSEVALSASQLAGRGSTGDIAAITLGGGLSMASAVLSAASGGWVLIASSIINSDVATVTFSSIPNTYTHLILIGRGRDTNTGAALDNYIQFNADTGANYDRQYFFGSGSTTFCGEASAQTKGNAGIFPGSTSSRAASEGTFEMLICSYATNAFEHIGVTKLGAAGGTSFNKYVGTQLVNWRDNSPITQIDLLATDKFKAGSAFFLCGII